MKFTNPIFSIPREELDKYIEDLNGDSISKRDHAFNVVKKAVNDWLDTAYDVLEVKVLNKLKSTTASSVFYKDSTVNKHHIRHIEFYGIKNNVVEFTGGRNVTVLAIENLYDELYIYKRFVELTSMSIQGLKNHIDYVLNDAVRYRTDIRFLISNLIDAVNNEPMFVWMKSNGHLNKMEEMVFEAVIMLKSFGYQIEKDSSNLETGICVLNFICDEDDEEPFKRRHKDALEVLLNEYASVSYETKTGYELCSKRTMYYIRLAFDEDYRIKENSEKVPE